MRKVLYTVGALLVLSPAAFAQTAATPYSGTNWVAISAAFGMALAAFGGALAQSRRLQLYSDPGAPIDNLEVGS